MEEKSREQELSVREISLIRELAQIRKEHKGRYDAEKNAVIISLEKDEQSALSPQKCRT